MATNLVLFMFIHLDFVFKYLIIICNKSLYRQKKPEAKLEYKQPLFEFGHKPCKVMYRKSVIDSQTMELKEKKWKTDGKYRRIYLSNQLNHYTYFLC